MFAGGDEVLDEVFAGRHVFQQLNTLNAITNVMSVTDNRVWPELLFEIEFAETRKYLLEFFVGDDFHTLYGPQGKTKLPLFG